MDGVPILPSRSSTGGGGGTKFGGPLSLFGLGGAGDSPVFVGGGGALRLGRTKDPAGILEVAVTTWDVVSEKLLSDSVGEVAGRMRVTVSSNLVDLLTRLLPLPSMKSHDIALLSGA